MIDLRGAFTSAGCEDVRTYIQSGNVIFSVFERESRKIFRNVQDGLAGLLGEEPQIMFRRLEDIRHLVELDPFKNVRGSAIKLYVAFLSHRPKPRTDFPIRSPEEALVVIGMQDLEAFIVSRRKKNGFYGFPNNFIEDKLGVTATTRNWTTVTKLGTL